MAVKSSTGRRGGSLPPGWWLAPAAALGTLLWVLIGMAVWHAGLWLAGVL